MEEYGSERKQKVIKIHCMHAWNSHCANKIIQIKQF